MKQAMKAVRMKRIREERGISKAELSRRANMQAGVVSWIETGRFVPYESQLQKLADALGVSDPEELLEVEEAAC